MLFSTVKLRFGFSPNKDSATRNDQYMSKRLLRLITEPRNVLGSEHRPAGMRNQHGGHEIQKKERWYKKKKVFETVLKKSRRNLTFYNQNISHILCRAVRHCGIRHTFPFWGMFVKTTVETVLWINEVWTTSVVTEFATLDMCWAEQTLCSAASPGFSRRQPGLSGEPSMRLAAEMEPDGNW